LSRTGSALDAQGLDLYTRVLSDSGHVHGVLSMMAAWRLKPLAARLHEVRNPVFMQIGAQDLTVPPSLADAACQLLPQARRHIQPGLGHLAHEQDPQGTAELILRWCAQG
jgi:magnesium chelatase accessory protein